MSMLTYKDSRAAAKKSGRGALPLEVIEKKIFLLRGQKVLLSTHLAELYAVEPKVLIQAVKRNRDRFPDDFLFQLSAEEFQNLKSQFVTSSWGGMRRAVPYAFTEQGVAMLSSVLSSSRAVQVNIAIMRAFVNLRRIVDAHQGLAEQLSCLEKKVTRQDKKIRLIFDAIRELMAVPVAADRPYKETKIGFSVDRDLVKSIRRARRDVREGKTIPMEKVFG